MAGAARPIHTEAAEARFNAFAEYLLGTGRAAKTVASYRSDWTGLVRWASQELGRPFDVTDLTADLVSRWRDELGEAQQQPATINRKLVFVKRFTDWDARFSGQERVEIRKVEAVPQPPRRPRGLDDSELGRFLTIVTREGSARDQAIVHTLLETGLKVSELVRLRRDDVVLRTRDGYLRVRTSAEGRGRTVTLGRVARRALRRWMGTRTDGHTSLFLGERGPLSANAVQRIVRKYCRKADVQVSPTTLRHTFAATFLQAGRGDLTDLADLLGHDCIETTRLYILGDGEDDEDGDDSEAVG
ncbi:MAG: tyrosine-type recombinase/integrase [bacterium]